MTLFSFCRSQIKSSEDYAVHCILDRTARKSPKYSLRLNLTLKVRIRIPQPRKVKLIILYMTTLSVDTWIWIFKGVLKSKCPAFICKHFSVFGFWNVYHKKYYENCIFIVLMKSPRHSVRKLRCSLRSRNRDLGTGCTWQI